MPRRHRDERELTRRVRVSAPSCHVHVPVRSIQALSKWPTAARSRRRDDQRTLSFPVSAFWLYTYLSHGTVMAQSHVRQQSAAALAAGHGAGAVLATCACCHSWATTWRRVGPSWSGWAYWTGCAAPRPCRCCGAAAAGRSRAFARRARREKEKENRGATTTQEKDVGRQLRIRK